MITNRVIIPLLCAASAVAFARGTTGSKPTLAAAGSSQSKTALSSIFTVKADRGVEFKLDVRNNTRRMVELRFPSGRTHDFVVKDESGKEVWRWSSSRMFTQGVQNKLVKAREAAAFSEAWKPENLRGKFTATAILVSDNHPIQETVAFELD